MEAGNKDFVAARKVQKADREKLRRDRLNEHFLELGNTIGEPTEYADPDRPKNDKASIISDTIQMLKDLTSEVNRLKAEHTALTDESRELTQEKNDLREEKASLKSDIESLHGQYQQRIRTMNPWMGMDHSVVMHPSSYTYSLPMPIATGPMHMPMHPSMQAYPFVPSPCPTFVPFMAPNTLVEQQPTQHGSSVAQPGGGCRVSSKQNLRYQPSDQGNSISEKTEDSSDVGTDLELKTPGSMSEQDLPSGQQKGKTVFRKATDDSSSSKCSSNSVHAVSSNSIVGGSNLDN